MALEAALPTGRRSRLWQLLGPGLITGASDDDPSGIATYCQAGAQLGYGISWVMLFTYPLMTVTQEISARIGRVTGDGIAGNMRRHYSPWLLQSVVGLLLLANVINLGADLSAMGEATRLLVGGPTEIYIVGFTVICAGAQIFFDYARYVSILKWSTLSLFAYFGVLMAIRIPWGEVAYHLVVPSLALDAGFVTTLVAVLGTTISPYLFFWQSSQEAEDIREDPKRDPLVKAPAQARGAFGRIRIDTYLGMALSNLVGLAIIVTAAATLNASGATTVETATQAAEALRPLAGPFAFALFAMGIIATGMLAVPVLAGSAAYAISEACNWPVGLGRRPAKARAFYGAVAVATFVGAGIAFSPIDPIRALYWSAVVNGVISAPVMAAIMALASRRKVMGRFTLPLWLTLLGWLTAGVMALSSGTFLILALVP